MFVDQLKAFFPAHKDIKYLAFWAAVIYGLFGVLYAFVFKGNIYLLLAMGGALNSAFIELRLIEFHFTHRFRMITAINITVIIPFVLGCICASYTLFAILGLLAASVILALTGNANKLVNVFAFVFSLLFVLGLNLPIHLIEAIYYGASLAAGTLIMSLVSLIHFSIKREPDSIPMNELLLDKSWCSFTQSKITYCVFLAVSACAAYGIAKGFDIPNSFWAPMTVFIVLKFDKEASYKLIWHRLIGTLCGIIAASPLIFFIHSPSVLIILIPVLMLLTTILAIGKYYGIYVFFLTMLTVIGFACLKDAGIESLESRLWDTLIGVGISALVIYILVPIYRKILKPNAYTTAHNI